MIDSVSKFTQLNIFDTMELDAMDFLYFFSYISAKNEQQRKELKKLQKK